MEQASKLENLDDESEASSNQPKNQQPQESKEDKKLYWADYEKGQDPFNFGTLDLGEN